MTRFEAFRDRVKPLRRGATALSMLVLIGAAALPAHARKAQEAKPAAKAKAAPESARHAAAKPPAASRAAGAKVADSKSAQHSRLAVRSAKADVAPKAGKGATRTVLAKAGRAAEAAPSSRRVLLVLDQRAGRKGLPGVGIDHVLAAARHDRAEPAPVQRLAAHNAEQAMREVTRPGARLSLGQMSGLHAVDDPLELKSSVALVLDQDTHEVLFSKNDHAVLPIASLTKLMTGLIVSEARLPLDEPITITSEDIDTEKGSSSRLPVGTTLTRGEMLHLALMSSENRAAHALGRTFPGGLARFVSLMNARALMLGMKDTRYVEPTGLSSSNRSSANDLATLVAAAVNDPLLRQFSTSPGYEVAVGSRLLQYNNTNRLVKSPEWDIGLQKTGYISEAGQCLVMQARVAGRKLIMVFLDSAGKYSRIADAERVRRWVEVQRSAATVAAAPFAG